MSLFLFFDSECIKIKLRKFLYMRLIKVPSCTSIFFLANQPKISILILTLEQNKEVISLYIVGKINKDIYKCVTVDIVTEEVIITEERIEHIKERHPNDYERYWEYLKEIIEDPDYIIETNRKNTALILKEIVESDERQFKTVVRLVTSVDDSRFKNSIITFMKINEKEWSRLIRNKKILYKKE